VRPHDPGHVAVLDVRERRLQPNKPSGVLPELDVAVDVLEHRVVAGAVVPHLPAHRLVQGSPVALRRDGRTEQMDVLKPR